MIITCDECYYSQYAGFASSYDKFATEYCVKFNKKLTENINSFTKPCEDCKGLFFKPDEFR